jgi:hypothetical protein
MITKVPVVPLENDKKATIAFASPGLKEIVL